MDRADANPGAELPDLLRATEQRLLALSRRCHELWLDSGRQALAEVASYRLQHDASRIAQAAHTRDVATLVKELAQQLEELSASLSWQAAALGGGPVQRPDVGRETLVLRAYEAERARVARDLHDGPAQYFANAVFEAEYLERVLGRDPEALALGLSRLRAGLQQGVDEIRRCLFDLRLPTVEQLGLVSLVRGYLSEYERQFGVAVETTLPAAELPVDGDQAIAIFRILQEALTNARKHSAAQQIRVELRRCDDELHLQVEDNGRGFAADRPRPSQYGLLGMQERAQLVGGRLEIDGRPGRGAIIVLRVPLR
jgi:two-component system sensor histidine kinase DegS